MREVSDTVKEVKVVEFVEAIKVTKTITGKVVCFRPFYYI